MISIKELVQDLSQEDPLIRDTILRLFDLIIYRSDTNLEWIVGPDEDMNWFQVNEWIKLLGPDWRFPTIEELRSIYKPNSGDRNMLPEFKTTGWWIWSTRKNSSLAWFFYFRSGDEYWHSLDDSFYNRGFVVRSRD